MRMAEAMRRDDTMPIPSTAQRRYTQRKPIEFIHETHLHPIIQNPKTFCQHIFTRVRSNKTIRILK